MSKLRKAIAWFRDAVPPLGSTRAERAVSAVSAVTKRAIAVDDALRAPHFYVFFYRGDQIRGGRVLPKEESGWNSPKQYWGPFDTQTAARDQVRAELVDGGLPRQQYKIQRLTAAEFAKIWGKPPMRAEEGY